MNLIIKNLPATNACVKEIQSEENENLVCQKLKTCCQDGRPDKSTPKGPFKPYVAVASELCVANICYKEVADLLFLLNLEQAFLTRYTQGIKELPKCQ